jgi:proteic killer suppression protein
MIKIFKHKGLKTLYEKDNASGVKQDQVKRLKSLLARLDASRSSADMDFPGLRLHTLQGDLAQYHAVCVSGNWRLIFRFDNDGNAADVDLVDYH